MTKFDPAFALKVMKRLQQEKNREAADLYLEKFDLLMQHKIGPYGHVYAELNRKIQDLWRQADSYDSVIDYLRERIWFEMTPDQRAWAVMKSWDYRPFPEAMQDVDEARKIASEVDAWREFG